MPPAEVVGGFLWQWVRAERAELTGVERCDMFEAEVVVDGIAEVACLGGIERVGSMTKNGCNDQYA